MKAIKQKSSLNFSAFFDKIKDYIFPVFCLGCRQEGEWLCEKCFSKIDLSGVFCCPVCHKNTLQGVGCEGCKDKSFLYSHTAITKYEENNLAGRVIQTLKYSWAEDVLLTIEKMIVIFLEKNDFLFTEIDCIVPVPLHKKREAERGFNQAEMIAHILADKLNKPIIPALERFRHTKQQAKLGREDRLKNMQNAFVLAQPVFGSVLVVDDVFTTGSTLQECALVLRGVEVERVCGFSLARG